MKADLLLRNIGQLVTAEEDTPKRGAAMRQLLVVQRAAIACSAGRVVWMGEERAWRGEADRVVDAEGRAVVPGLVDPHTHAMWAGDRMADFDARTSGKTYEEILAAGGGIRSTIRATAAASHGELVALTLQRVQLLLRNGATTIEVKSGYGFSVAGELAMLRAIRDVAAVVPARLVPTLLIHIPPVEAGERVTYLDGVCCELVPAVAREGLATAVDVFVEKEAWRADEAERVLTSARECGLAVKLHTEQFHRVGGLELGLRMDALSVDHLEVCEPSQCEALGASATVATVLPGVSLHLGIPAAPGRRLIDAGAAVAVGTDLNPGSSPLYSMATALALAVRLNGLNAAEALVAGTLNAACALGKHEAGRIAVGLPADLLVLESSDWRDLVYTLGGQPVRAVYVAGERVAG